MSIWDMFRPKGSGEGSSSNPPQNNQQQQVQQPAPGQPQSGTGNPAPNSQLPPEPKSPLDEYKDLWQTPTNKDGQQPVDPLTQPLLSTDPAKLQDAARKMNFTAGIPQETMQKVLSGDHQALIEVINSTAQNAFLAASQLGTSVAEGAVKVNNERLTGTLEGKFKEYLTMHVEQSDNPVLNHPATAPLLDLAKRQLMSKHPDKSPREINQMATQLMEGFASQFTQNQQAVASKGGQQQRDPTDFSNWL